MPGLFNGINFRVKKTPDSSIDLRLLDVDCNHQIIDEAVIFDRNELFGQNAYSSGGPYGSSLVYSGYNPNKFVYISTKLPYFNNAFVSLLENPAFSSFESPIVETTTLSYSKADFPITYRLLFPPKPNSLSIKQLVTTVATNCGIDDVQTIKLDFTNYTLSQLNGIITFNESSDASIVDKPTVLEITYVADEKNINPKSKDMYVNWEYVGVGKNNVGIFKVYARSFVSIKSGMYLRYTTIPSFCPRCYGTNLVNDIQFDSQGKVLVVYDFVKLIQDYFKRLFTKKFSNIFHTDEGSYFPSFIGTAKANAGTIQALIRNEFVKMVTVVRDKQKIQIPIQGISNAEQIAYIEQLTVTAVDPTSVSVDMKVRSKSNDIALLSASIKQ